jgi:hypothetical protein
VVDIYKTTFSGSVSRTQIKIATSAVTSQQDLGGFSRSQASAVSWGAGHSTA